MEWWGVFWSTLFQDDGVFEQLWIFIRGWAGVAIIVGSGILMVGFALLGAKLRDTFGWLAAIFGMMSATIAAWWAFGIIPSAWIYFADGQRDLMEGTVIAKELGFPPNYVIASNFYEVFRDMVVMGETTIAMIAFAVIALRVQARYPRALAEGEEARPQSGGYK